ncbi:adhesion G protein-coupled receptor L4-like, partial [Oculina patagonica]
MATSKSTETEVSSSSTRSTGEASKVLKDEPDTDNELNSENPLLELSTLMNSLNPRDPQSLKVATDAYEVFATSVQDKKKAGTVNLIDSTQIIEDFAFKYASFNLNASNTEERKENKHIVLQVSLVQKGYTGNFTFTEEDDTEEVARITLPSSLFHKQDTLVVNALYRDLHEFVDNSGSRNNKIDSMILGSDVRPSEQETFTENVTIVLRTLEENNNKTRKNCVFWQWNFSHPANGSWSGDGCSLVDSNSSHVVCTCNHLTNFAILMNIKQHKFPDKHRQALSYITYIGLGISILGETVTIVAYLLLLCSSNDQQSHVHVNLVTTLAMAQVIFLAGIDATHDQVLCITVAALIHYFYLSSFCWMLIEGVMLYLFIIEVYNTELKLPLCYCFSLGFPGIVVGGALTIAHLKSEGIHQYTANSWCWLSTEKYYIWSFAGPVILITAVNMVIFCIVVKEMVNMASMQPSKLSRVKATVKACIVLFPLLGITWLFGLLSITSTSVVPQYVFTVLNSIQVSICIPLINRVQGGYRQISTDVFFYIRHGACAKTVKGEN